MDTTVPEDVKSPYTFGIDLGTSNSAIAVYMKGEARIIEIEGRQVCPSVISVLDNGEIKVGYAAKSRLIVDPENTVASIKREMGTNWTKQFGGLPDQTYTPADVSAEILSKLVSGAQESGVDLKGTPRSVVICIPANFNDAQKTATKQAAELANLELQWLLEEPQAAALAYAVDQDRDQTILVYDLGGGTLDVAILKVKSTTEEGDRRRSAGFEFLAKEGVPRLGGDDFDRKIMEIAAAKFQETSNVDILDVSKDQGISPKAIREAQQKLKEAAEAAKIELTEAESSKIIIPNLIKDESGNLHSLDMHITREELNGLIRELVMQSKSAVERALTSAEMTIEDISRIILVGGSTKVPLVKGMLTEIFGREPYGDLNPDTVVARGAAIYGATFETPDLPEGDRFDGGITINNIVTHYLGIETAGGKFVYILEKGAEIPTEEPLTAGKVFVTPRDDMTTLAIRVYQSDREAEFVRSEGVDFIGEFFLKGIPPKPRGQEQVTVTFQIDQQNLLTVTATSPNVSGELEIQRS